MTGRERMDRAMRPREGQLPDRVPVMCQLALGHYFLNTERDAIDIWHDSDALADVLVAFQRRYRFDGILVNLPGRDPRWRDAIVSIEKRPNERIVRWRGGYFTVVPPDDNPRVCLEATGRPATVAFDEIDPARLFYVEPHDQFGVTCQDHDRFPPWHWDTLARVRALAPDVSLHGEVFSPFSQIFELVGCHEGLLAMMLHPAKMHGCLSRLTEGAAALGRGHFAAGADAVLISSAYAGAAFLSRAHYQTFVLPYERALVRGLKDAFPGRPVYTHTCGAIGDRLDLLQATGTDGIDTLDPPPLGTTDLAEAKNQLAQRVFIKGNVNPVDTVLRGTVDTCYRDACDRLAIAKDGGGYILSTACSVPPHAPPENILALTRAAEDAGWYDT
jgi:uroporphyrinogen-III decarboxylase